MKALVCGFHFSLFRIYQFEHTFTNKPVGDVAHDAVS